MNTGEPREVDRAPGNESPDVSVVIATRERPALLRRAVTSILAQRDVGAVEIVIVFDGGELDELSEFVSGAHRIRTLRNSRTPGLAGARNTGILSSSAPLIAFCDDDDEWKPAKLSTQLRLMQDPQVVLSATGIEIHSAGGMVSREAPSVVALADLIRSRITELHPSSFILRASALRGELGLVDERLPASYGEDYDLLLRAAKVGRIVAERECLTIVHWDRTSFFTDRWHGIADGLRYLLAKHPEFSGSAVGQARIEGQIAFAYAALGALDDARSWARRALVHDALQARAYLAFLVGVRAVSGERVVAALNRRGRGV